MGRYVYVIGGTAKEPIASELVWRLDLESWAWTRLDGPNSGMPKPSYFHTCAVSPVSFPDAMNLSKIPPPSSSSSSLRRAHT